MATPSKTKPSFSYHHICWINCVGFSLNNRPDGWMLVMDQVVGYPKFWVFLWVMLGTYFIWSKFFVHSCLIFKVQARPNEGMNRRKSLLNFDFTHFSVEFIGYSKMICGSTQNPKFGYLTQHLGWTVIRFWTFLAVWFNRAAQHEFWNDDYMRSNKQSKMNECFWTDILLRFVLSLLLSDGFGYITETRVFAFKMTQRIMGWRKKLNKNVSFLFAQVFTWVTWWF